MHLKRIRVKIRLMEKLRYFIFALTLFLTLQTSACYAALLCGPLKEKIKQILTEEHMAFVAMGEINNNVVLLIFQDQDGNFKLVGVDSKKNACELISGRNLQPPEEKEF